MRRSLFGYGTFDFVFCFPFCFNCDTDWPERERQTDRQTHREGGGGWVGWRSLSWKTVTFNTCSGLGTVGRDRLLCRAVSLEHYNLLLYEHSSSVLGASSRNEMTCCQDSPPPPPPQIERVEWLQKKSGRGEKAIKWWTDEQNHWVSPLRRKTSDGLNLFTPDLHIFMQVHD